MSENDLFADLPSPPPDPLAHPVFELVPAPEREQGKPRSGKWKSTGESKRAYLIALYATGTIKKACVQTKIGRAQIRAWRESDAKFDAAVARVSEHLADRAEAEILRLMEHSESEEIRLRAAALVLKAYRKEYGPKVAFEGNVTLTFAQALVELDRRHALPG
jgi:hypothetical protein